MTPMCKFSSFVAIALVTAWEFCPRGILSGQLVPRQLCRSSIAANHYDFAVIITISDPTLRHYDRTLKITISARYGMTFRAVIERISYVR